MMGFDGGWIGPLIMLGLLIGVMLVVVAAMSAGGRSEDDALENLRARFARGEIDADRFEEMRRTLGGEGRRRAGTNFGLIGVVLIVAAIVLSILIGSVIPGSWGGPGGWGGMMGGGGMMGIRAGPTAPAEISVRMAGSRFEPSTLTVGVGETVQWFNDDALPHTVSADDRAWDSGNLAPGQRFERRFEEPGLYPYVCRYHSGMVGTVEVDG